MNRKQWSFLASCCILIGIMFIGLDSIHNYCLNTKLNYVSYGELDISDVWCVVNAEMYEPFIYLSFLLFWVFFIIGLLEPKEKK